MLPGLQLTFDPVNGEGSERGQLLALSRLRRNLESDSPAHTDAEPVATMIVRTRSRAAGRLRTVRHLHELIAALDRRVPQVQRAGEASIAHAAAALRSDAVKRIQELEGDARTAAGPDDLR